MAKIKFGKCKECPENSPEKPLKDKYHCQHHYWIFREEVAEEKKKKRAEMNAFLGKPEPVKKKPKPIPKVSAKRKIEDREYTIKRLQFLAQPENQRCPITMEKATEIHHTYSGANRSKYYLDESTWVAVSRNGHLWIHANPAESREQGYLKTY